MKLVKGAKRTRLSTDTGSNVTRLSETHLWHWAYKKRPPLRFYG